MLAVPMLLEMVLATLFNLVDMVWVGKLGTSAIAAVSMGGVTLMLAFSLVVGISLASTAMISRRVGECAWQEANIVIFHTLVLSAIVSFLYLMISGYSKNMVVWMGAKGEVVFLGTEYLEVCLIGGGTVVFLSSINGLFRGAGHAFEPMVILFIANLINLILDPCLIFGLGVFPRMGVRGAALSTVFSYAVCVCVQFLWLVKGKLSISIGINTLRFKIDVLKTLVSNAIPASFQLLLRIASTFVLMRIVADYGVNAVAAYGIGLCIFRLVVLPGLGIGNAASTMVGQNIGARNFKRASKSAWLAALYSMLILGGLGIVLAIFAHPVAAFFTKSTQVINMGAKCIRILTLCFVFCGLGIVMSRSLIGAGDAITPMVVNFISLWLLQIPLAYYLANYMGFMESGVWISVSISNCIGAIMSSLCFKGGRWYHKRI